MIKKILIAVCLWVPFLTQCSSATYQITKNAAGRKGAVVSAHALASQAGLEILKQGGNAMDAAITTQFVLAVVHPSAGNLGGGGYTIAHFKDGKTLAIDYRETAPAKAHRDMYLDSLGMPIKNLSLRGALAGGVPGSVAGIIQCLPYARFPLAKLITPAILLAEKGFILTDGEAKAFNRLSEEFLKYNRQPVAFVKDGGWKAGDKLIQPALALTLKRIRSQGFKGFYEGETARGIAADVSRAGGIISEEDLKNYQAVVKPIMRFNYKDVEVLSMPLSSSGGIMLKQMLTMVANADLGKSGFHSPEAMQWMIEAERRSFADRAFYLGDDAQVHVPVTSITNAQYLKNRVADVIPGVAGKSVNPGHGIPKESEQTTHFSVIDKDGNAVSVTTTLNDGYGSRFVVSSAGFILNDEMDDFSIKEGFPNMYGALGNAANAIAPGKRMLSSMTPTIVLKNNQPYLVTGTPGGTTIPTSVFQTILNVVEFNLSANDAVNLPKFHHQWLPDVVYVERTMDSLPIQKLKKMGYVITPRESIGRTELIVRDGKGNITAVADKRGADDARAY
ncbi:MAG: gamma-glutamyltransferase [Ferruginibacter sp.]